MNTLRTRNQLAVAAATVALVGLAAGCSSTKQEAPTTPPSTTVTSVTTQPSVTPTENDLSPTGANKFTPTHIQMPAPPTAGEGEHFH